MTIRLRSRRAGGARFPVAAELAFSLMLLLADALVLHGTFSRELVLDAVACVGIAILPRRPRAGLLVTDAAMLVLSLQPARSVGLGIYLGLVPVVASVARGRTSVAMAGSTVFMALALHLTERGNPGGHRLGMTVFWALLLVGAWLLGLGSQRLMRAERRRYDEQLRAQRVQIAAEIHDRVAHDLALLSLRTEEALLAGTATRDDLELMGRMARDSNRSLRRLMRLLFVEDEFRPVAPRDLGATLRECRSELVDEGFQVSCEHTGPPIERLSATVADLVAKVVRATADEVLLLADRQVPCAVFNAVRRDRVVLCVTTGVAGGAVPIGRTLAGVREQAEAVGGSVVTSLVDDTWVMTATIPR